LQTRPQITASHLISARQARVTAGFLQIPPHGGYPCLELTLPTTKRLRELQPRACSHAGHKKKRREHFPPLNTRQQDL